MRPWDRRPRSARCARAAKCQCGYIVDPFSAYGKLYDENEPGGLMTARRMTKEQLQELHLYPRIKPLAEHLADLNAEAEPNKPAKRKEAKNEKAD
jgi:hypothetical protein